jgi:glycosyltransferase involved in cell wall biosynthesis
MYQDVDLVILGDGPLRPRLEKMISDYGLGDRIHLIGFDRNPYRWMARCRLFILPSRTEGFPNALLEAMALRCPVIASDCPSGPREMLSPESPAFPDDPALEWARYGLLTGIPEVALPTAEEPLSGAEKGLARGIDSLLSDGDTRERYADRALNRAQSFTRDRVLEKWIERVEA